MPLVGIALPPFANFPLPARLAPQQTGAQHARPTRAQPCNEVSLVLNICFGNQEEIFCLARQIIGCG